jgi:hypothetical protein
MLFDLSGSRGRYVFLAWLFLTAALALPAESATIRYQSDAELIQFSARVVRGRVLSVSAERTGSSAWIHTVTRIAVLEDFTGFTDQVITIRELGGTAGGETLIVGGGVTYEPGQEVVVCLEALPDGRYRSIAMGLSKFDIAPTADGDAVMVRNLRGSVIVGRPADLHVPQRLSVFRRLAEGVRGVRAARPRGAEALVPEQSVVMPFTLLTFNNGLGVRWIEADSGVPVRWYRSSAAPSPLISGDGTAEIQSALSAWTAPPSASIVLQYGGTTAENDPGATTSGGIGVIFFEDPHDELSGNVLAIGGGYATAGDGGTINGTTFNRYTRGYVIFQNAADLSASFRQSLNFTRVLEHEIGHGIGLGHTQTDGSVANPDSNIMYASCCSGNTPTPPALGPDDLAGLNFIYPAPQQTCNYSLSQNSASFPGAGGSISVSIATPSGCPWSVSGPPAWIAATPSSGNGPNSVLLSIQPNPAGASSRSASIAIAGSVFTVTEASCTASTTPAALWLPAIGGTRNLQITTGGCSWTASDSVSWTAITPASGSGDSIASVVLSPNPSPAARSTTLTIAGLPVPLVQGGRSVAADVNFDGRADLIWQHDDGRISSWLMNGIQMMSGALIGPGSVADTNWKIVGTWDPNGDGSTDILWRHQTQGWLSSWTMNGENLVGGAYLSPAQVADTNWTVVGTGDFNGDGRPDILWQHATEGWVSVWLMNGTTLIDGRLLSASRVADTNWKIVGSGDFNGDGLADIVWQHQTTGETSVWIMNGTTLVNGTLLSPAGVGDTNWKIKAVTDLNGDGQPDLVWQNTATGYLAAWLMNGTVRADGIYLTPAQVLDTRWHIVGPR